MWNNTLIITILIGLLAGIIGGFFGISGAFIIIVALLALKLVPDSNTAAGTTLFILLPPISILAVMTYWKRKQVNLKIAIPIMITYIIAAFIGSYWSHLISDRTQKLLLALLFIILASIMLYTYLTYKDKKNINTAFNSHLLI